MGARDATSQLRNWPLRQDLIRHLDDLRIRTYEGASSRADREAVFHKAVSLLAPVVVRVLTETNIGCLANSGEIQFHPAGDDPSSDLISTWTLSWPAQREARSRNEGEQVAPIQVIAKMGRTALHGVWSESRRLAVADHELGRGRSTRAARETHR
jgi:hypothetical protein